MVQQSVASMTAMSVAAAGMLCKARACDIMHSVLDTMVESAVHGALGVLRALLAAAPGGDGPMPSQWVVTSIQRAVRRNSPPHHKKQ